jgi:hypothetical protein
VHRNAFAFINRSLLGTIILEIKRRVYYIFVAMTKMKMMMMKMSLSPTNLILRLTLLENL